MERRQLENKPPQQTREDEPAPEEAPETSGERVGEEPDLENKVARDNSIGWGFDLNLIGDTLAGFGDQVSKTWQDLGRKMLEPGLVAFGLEHPAEVSEALNSQEDPLQTDLLSVEDQEAIEASTLKQLSIESTEDGDENATGGNVPDETESQAKARKKFVAHGILSQTDLEGGRADAGKGLEGTEVGPPESSDSTLADTVAKPSRPEMFPFGANRQQVVTQARMDAKAPVARASKSSEVAEATGTKATGAKATGAKATGAKATGAKANEAIDADAPKAKSSVAELYDNRDPKFGGPLYQKMLEIEKEVAVQLEALLDKSPSPLDRHPARSRSSSPSPPIDRN
ncbi:hypothetical protein GNI_010680 [Gregarina niphandrodes]|uniref:Uncharacterized protein n=1 Tax=Gregarina niphandrodes TaxID=110365 RepID=A0A023BCY9_GRENI|nr:hypothetical protein GNI_010680 [Gregarina niphandrodes]EZG86206.1 hypothetical protein GNI_010680 [Gregarina niphandrodes]|eukprot:XP_011128774.1 hypothetical protein GNI_010680 [Gregarina niphandrodes]